MNLYLEKTSEEEMKKDFDKLNDFKQGVLTGMKYLIEDFDNIDTNLDYGLDGASTILDKIKKEIRDDCLSQTRKRFYCLMLEHLTAFVDDYYANLDEE